MDKDIEFMKEAIKLSRKNKDPYGAVIVRNGQIIGRSNAKTPVTKSIYDHAELIAIEDAHSNTALMGNLKGCTLYCTVEPCMMCFEAILYQNIKRIVYGIEIEAGNIYYNHPEDFSVLDLVKKINPNLEIVGGVCRDEALEVIKDYNTKIEANDEKYIDMAIEISKKSFYPFGAIVVRRGEIIGKSTEDTPIKSTLYRHAELVAMESAVNNIKDSLSRGNLHGCTLYTSCEPCMLCQEAILAEGISRVVYAATIEDSNKYFCEEFSINLEEIVKIANSKLKIVPELHRAQAVEVLKKHGRKEE